MVRQGIANPSSPVRIRVPPPASFAPPGLRRPGPPMGAQRVTTHVHTRSLQGEGAAGSFYVEAAGMTLEHSAAPTGQTVGEPNQDWHIDNFVSHRLGEIEFPEAGVYEVSLQVKAEQARPLKFQWLWLKMEDRRRPGSHPVESAGRSITVLRGAMASL